MTLLIFYMIDFILSFEPSIISSTFLKYDLCIRMDLFLFLWIKILMYDKKIIYIFKIWCCIFYILQH